MALRPEPVGLVGQQEMAVVQQQSRTITPESPEVMGMMPGLPPQGGVFSCMPVALRVVLVGAVVAGHPCSAQVVQGEALALPGLPPRVTALEVVVVVTVGLTAGPGRWDLP